jgi:hypothetical protein
MPAGKKLRLSARFIVLDLIGTLLIVAGTLDLAGALQSDPFSRLITGHGWTLVIFGAFSVTVAGISPLKQLVARQRASNSGLSSGSERQAIRRSAR